MEKVHTSMPTGKKATWRTLNVPIVMAKDTMKKTLKNLLERNLSQI